MGWLPTCFHDVKLSATTVATCASAVAAVLRCPQNLQSQKGTTDRWLAVDNGTIHSPRDRRNRKKLTPFGFQSTANSLKRGSGIALVAGNAGEAARLAVEGPYGRAVPGAIAESLSSAVRHIDLEHHHFGAIGTALPALHAGASVEPDRVQA